jgi:hypothetical protein
MPKDIFSVSNAANYFPAGVALVCLVGRAGFLKFLRAIPKIPAIFIFCCSHAFLIFSIKKATPLQRAS